MNKKIISAIVIVIVVALLLSVIYLFTREDSDAIKFKKEYESLNGEVNENNNKEYRSIEISKNNPIIYSSAEEVLEMMDNGDSFAVYFGFSKCPWCRSVLPTMFEVASDLGIDTIYYVDVLDIRNTLEVVEEQEIVESKKGTDGYYKLLDRLSDVLDFYSLTDSEGNAVDSNQKRIYAPNIVAIVDGRAENLTTGISDSQEDGYQEITKDMKKDMYNKIKCCLECLSDTSGVCTKNAC